MADLSQLFQYAPGTAAAMLGGQQYLDEQTQQLHQQELQHLISARDQQQQFDAQKQPGELEKLRLGNIGQDVTNQKVGLENDLSRGTMGSKIDAGNNENYSKAYTAIAQHLGSLSAAIQDNPNVPPHVAMTQALQTTGMPPQAAQKFMERYSNVPPQQLAQRLQEDSQRVLRESPAYVQAYDPAATHADATVFAGAQHNASQERIAQQQIAAGRYQYHGKPNLDEDQLIDKESNTVKKYGLLLDAAKKAMIRGDTERAQHYQARADYLENAASASLPAPNKPATIDFGKETGMSTVQPPTITPPANQRPAPYNAPPGADVTGRGVPGKDFFPGIPTPAVQKFQSSDPNAKITFNGQTKTAAEWFDAKFGAGAAAAVLRAKK